MHQASQHHGVCREPQAGRSCIGWHEYPNIFQKRKIAQSEHCAIESVSHGPSVMNRRCQGSGEFKLTHCRPEGGVVLRNDCAGGLKDSIGKFPLAQLIPDMLLRNGSWRIVRESVQPDSLENPQVHGLACGLSSITSRARVVVLSHTMPCARNHSISSCNEARMGPGRYPSSRFALSMLT